MFSRMCLRLAALSRGCHFLPLLGFACRSVDGSGVVSKYARGFRLSGRAMELGRK